MSLNHNDIKNKIKPSLQLLPCYKKDWLSFFSPCLLFFQNLPFSEFIIIPFLFLYSKKRSEPDKLYHFVESEEVFFKILNKRLALSLAGGKLHTTSNMNPFLGKKVKDSKKSFYVLVIENPRDISLFEPIVYGLRYFHSYKWWKHLRREYTFSELKDVGFKLRGDVVYEEEKCIKNINRRFLVAYIYSLKPEGNVRFVQKAQKRLFYLGEFFLSFLTFYISTLFSYIYIFYDAIKKVIYDFLPIDLSSENLKLIFYIFLSVIVVLLPLCIIAYVYLRAMAIKSRE